MPESAIHLEYEISDDPARLDVAAIHAFLTRSYWAEGIARSTVEQSIRHSLAIGIYIAAAGRVGFMRVISDYTSFAYLCDVYILEAHRGRGLARAALRFVMSHPRLATIRRYALVTRDAHRLYAEAGFTPLADPARHMEKRISRPPVPSASGGVA